MHSVLVLLADLVEKELCLRRLVILTQRKEISSLIVATKKMMVAAALRALQDHQALVLSR
jgi:hypothetical protein